MNIATTLLCSVALLTVQGGSQDLSVIQHFLHEGRYMQVPDEKIYRMELDVTGDGQPELFLSLDQTLGNGGQEWLVYSPRPDGTTLDYLGYMGFHPGGFSFDPETREFKVWGRISGSEGFVMTYQIDASGIHELGRSETTRSQEEEGEAARQHFDEGRAKTKVRVLWTELGSALEKQETTWRDYFSKEAAEEAISSLGAFHVVEAARE